MATKKRSPARHTGPKAQTKPPPRFVENGSERGRGSLSGWPGKEGVRGPCATRQGADIFASANGRVGAGCRPDIGQAPCRVERSAGRRPSRVRHPRSARSREQHASGADGRDRPAVEAGTHRARPSTRSRANTGSRSAAATSSNPRNTSSRYRKHPARPRSTSPDPSINPTMWSSQARTSSPRSNGRPSALPRSGGSLLRDA